MDTAIDITVLPLGPLQVNTCLIRCGVDWAVVDPTITAGRALKPLLQGACAAGLILLTHTHADHTAGVEEVRALAPESKLYCPAAEADMLNDAQGNLSFLVGLSVQAGLPDRLLTPGDCLSVGESLWQVLDTAGHTVGGVSFYCERAGVAIVGDTLFAGGIGRYDLPGASFKRLRNNVRANLFTLPPQTRVIPGHGMETTVEAERTTNTFFLLS